jgi:hypothetical protein
MSYLRSTITDLREKRLWPVALALVAALVAIPLLLSASGESAPVAQRPETGPAVPATSAASTVSVQEQATRSRLPGRGHDPFAQQQTASTVTSGAKSTATTKTAALGSSGSAAATGSTASGGTGVATAPASTVPPTTTTPPSTPTTTSKPAPTGLTSFQAYHVTVSITNAKGGLDTLDPLERLSFLPSGRQPLLVQLGVLKGGRRVLFVVLPGTVVTGPGTCTPGPIDCEILSLAPGQTEGLSMQSPTGVVSVAQFAVTAITADQHSSTAAADKARRMASAAGRRLLSKATLGALSLFQYRPSVGAVVDLRNLTVGGS